MAYLKEIVKPDMAIAIMAAIAILAGTLRCEQKAIRFENRLLHRIKIRISRLLLKSKRVYQWTHPKATVNIRPRAVIGDYSTTGRNSTTLPDWVPDSIFESFPIVEVRK